MPAYTVPKQSIETEYQIKKSRFIARAAYAPDRATAMAQLQQAKLDYPDARHHCWAYVLGQQHSAAMSDDGEPSGTAGKPILNVLQHKHIGDIMLIVIRYFGGIKLGAGGLVRAYSSATQQALDALPLETASRYQKGYLLCDFSQEQAVRYQLQQHQGKLHDCQYQEQVKFELSIPETELSSWNNYLSSNNLNWKTEH